MSNGHGVILSWQKRVVNLTLYQFIILAPVYN